MPSNGGFIIQYNPGYLSHSFVTLQQFVGYATNIKYSSILVKRFRIKFLGAFFYLVVYLFSYHEKAIKALYELA